MAQSQAPACSLETCPSGGGIRGALVRQFGNPSGAAGWWIGHLMALKNRRRNRDVCKLLNLQVEDTVLEIGFGPGALIAELARTARFVAGVDHSATMVSQARQRNSRAIGERRVDLREAAASRLPFPDCSFHKVLSINSAQFWPDLAAAFREIARVLKPGGLAVIAVQPRTPGAGTSEAEQAGRHLGEAARSAALVAEVRLLDSGGGAPVACAICRSAASIPCRK